MNLGEDKSCLQMQFPLDAIPVPTQAMIATKANNVKQDATE